ncbi:hypothetical protein BGI33_06685 [Snodgrassella alvi]|uniref:Uncharacterized protein n=1 Tax=Snodgrassella alvi TaxID=1196083 RepID=A0A2N9WU77_9NEIS|nr:hypothetical protein BGI33_06685 [Snodgrassella alvi]PIT15590.1 hypothetical protein BGI32_05335 [Snodgrassella alvi]PIT16296.1 hypothetical protein BGI34_09640 [Snodgrassella alvi]
MLRLFPPSMILVNSTQVSPKFCHINLRENNTFKPDRYPFIRYKLNYLKKLIIYQLSPTV